MGGLAAGALLYGALFLSLILAVLLGGVYFTLAGFMRDGCLTACSDGKSVQGHKLWLYAQLVLFVLAILLFLGLGGKAIYELRHPAAETNGLAQLAAVASALPTTTPSPSVTA
jgi:hypothetical protein